MVAPERPPGRQLAADPAATGTPQRDAFHGTGTTLNASKPARIHSGRVGVISNQENPRSQFAVERGTRPGISPARPANGGRVTALPSNEDGQIGRPSSPRITERLNRLAPQVQEPYPLIVNERAWSPIDWT